MSNNCKYNIYQRTTEKIFLFSPLIFDVHRWDCNGSVTKLHSDFADMSGYTYITGVQLSLPRLVIVFNGPVMTSLVQPFL